MAYHYVSADRDQLFLLPVSMRYWLPEDYLAWFVIDVVAKINTTSFHALHRNDGPGRPAYDPDMMLALLFYAYANGIRSSRRVEALCGTDAAYRVITGGHTPDHATIARFVVNHQKAIEAAFVDVLRLCQAAGLVSVGMIAIDGTKMVGNAAMDMNRTAGWIETEVERILSEVTDTDTAEDQVPAQFGFDLLPVELSTSKGRLARLAQALTVIADYDAQVAEEIHNRAEKAMQDASEGRKVPGPKPKDPHEALLGAEADELATRVRGQADAAKRALEAVAKGREPQPYSTDLDLRVQQAVDATSKARRVAEAAEPVALHQANITDPDSRIMKTKNGFIQGYNCQSSVNENQIAIACTVTQEANDLSLYQPMVAASLVTLTAIGVTETVGVVLADAGYCNDHNLTVAGPSRLIATLKDHKQRTAARKLGTTTGEPPKDATFVDAMEHRLRTAEGAAAYAMRSHTIEPLFGNIKTNLDFDTFNRRGLAAVAAEWSLMNITHNLLKLFRHTQASPTPT